MLVVAPRLSHQQERAQVLSAAGLPAHDRPDDPGRRLLQAYSIGWGIEVNHRDEKDILGVGQAQVWNKDSVSKSSLLVAMYSWLQLRSRPQVLRPHPHGGL